VKVVAYGSSEPGLAVRMGTKLCEYRRSGKTRKKARDGHRSAPLRGRLFSEFAGETARREWVVSPAK
jgi:hypothetical protein